LSAVEREGDVGAGTTWAIAGLARPRAGTGVVLGHSVGEAGQCGVDATLGHGRRRGPTGLGARAAAVVGLLSFFYFFPLF